MVVVVLVLVRSYRMMGSRCRCRGSRWVAMASGTDAVVVVVRCSILAGRRGHAGYADDTEWAYCRHLVGCLGRTELVGYTGLLDHAHRRPVDALVNDVHMVAAVHNLALLLLRILATASGLVSFFGSRLAGHTVCRMGLDCGGVDSSRVLRRSQMKGWAAHRSPLWVWVILRTCPDRETSSLLVLLLLPCLHWIRLSHCHCDPVYPAPYLLASVVWAVPPPEHVRPFHLSTSA
jgi:hypothetical protein